MDEVGDDEVYDGEPDADYEEQQDFDYDCDYVEDEVRSDAPVHGGAGAGVISGSSAPAARTVGLSARCIPEAQVPGMLTDMARGVAEVACCNEDEAILLLACFKWHPRRVQDALFSGDGDALRAKLGLAPLGAAADVGLPPLPAGASPSDTFFDESTMEDSTYAEADACARGHWFSSTTWLGHLQTAAKEPLTALTRTRCPAYPECNELVRPRLFRRFVPELMPRLELFRSRVFAEECSAPVFRRCPAPDCT